MWPAPFKRDQEHEDTATTLVTNQQKDEQAWIYEIPTKNSFLHVQRVVAYILRFVRNVQKPKESRPNNLQLSLPEMDQALKHIIRQIQAADFPQIKAKLLKEQFVEKSNHISSLAPFLDEEGIIRVGGRISASSQPNDARHQMILPDKDSLVKLLVEGIHKDHYHCGPQALLAQVRQRFWPLKGKSLARSVVQKCVRCVRARPTLFKQLMGNLPSTRVEPARPFIHSGVDYCGPF